MLYPDFTVPANAHIDRITAHQAAADKIAAAYKLLIEASEILADDEPLPPGHGANGEPYTYKARCFGYDLHTAATNGIHSIDSNFPRVEIN